MYELFLTAFVDGSDLNAACSVLSGLCGMPPWESLTRVLFYQGPPKPPGLSNYRGLEKMIRKESAYHLKELHTGLSRQSFILQTRYEVRKDRDLGPNAPVVDLDDTPGMLLWTDFPDQPGSKPHLTQRKKVEVWEQKKLPTLMSNNNFQFKTEIMEESYRFYRDDVEFCLSRQLFIRSINDHIPLESRSDYPTPPYTQLPAWDFMTPVDSQGRWTLLVKVHVLQDNKPDEIAKGQSKLQDIRRELEGVLNFRVIDRKVHDTRVAQQQQGVQVLPQKVTVGKA